MRLSKAMHYGVQSGCKSNNFFESINLPEISRNYISEINRKSSFVPFLSLFRGIPLHCVCGMGRCAHGTEHNGRRQIAPHLRTPVAPPPIPIFPSERAPHSASLRSKRSGIPVIQECKPSFVLSSARVGDSAALCLRNGATS